MTSTRQSQSGSARVQEEEITRQSHMEPTGSGNQVTITDQFCGDIAGGLHAQDGCSNGTFVVGMLVRCEACGKKFINSFYLRKHVLKRHSGDAPYSEGLSDAGLPAQNAAAVRLQSRKENSLPSALTGYTKTDSRVLEPADTGTGGEDEVTGSRSKGNWPPACGIGRNLFSMPQYTLKQNKVSVSRPWNRNEKVKAEVHEEVNIILKTFQTMLKNEIRGLQTQLAGLEANEEKKYREKLICTARVGRLPNAGELRNHVEEATSDPDQEASCKTSLYTGMKYERRGADRSRPGSAPEREFDPVKTVSCPERNGPQDTKETLRQAIRTLLTYSHREFFFRAQMPNVVKHNSKPLPEEIERHLGLPSLSISSQLAKSFLKEGLQHCHRSGLTTGNAPQNFELAAGAPPLFAPEKSCSYHIQKGRDLPAQRRFSLKFTRLRDRLRLRPLSPVKVSPPSVSATYMGVSAVTQRPVRLPLVHKQLGYRQLVQPLPLLPFPHPPSLLPTHAHSNPAGGPSALVQEEQLSKPFAVAQQSPARHCPGVDVSIHTSERTPPHAEIQRVSARRRPQSPGVQSNRNTVGVLAGHTTISHSSLKRGMSTPYACPGLAGTCHGELLKERAKSVVEANCARPAHTAEALLSDPPLLGEGELDFSKSHLAPRYSGGGDSVQRRGAWPCPSSWMSVPCRDPGNLQVQERGCTTRISASARPYSTTRVPVREQADDTVDATPAHCFPSNADAKPAEPESSSLCAKDGRGSKDSFLEDNPVEAARPLLHQKALWQYAVRGR